MVKLYMQKRFLVSMLDNIAGRGPTPEHTQVLGHAQLVLNVILLRVHLHMCNNGCKLIFIRVVFVYIKESYE